MSTYCDDGSEHARCNDYSDAPLQRDERQGTAIVKKRVTIRTHPSWSLRSIVVPRADCVVRPDCVIVDQLSELTASSDWLDPSLAPLAPRPEFAIRSQSRATISAHDQPGCKRIHLRS